MPIKNTVVTITLLVWDFGNNCGKTGQEANITLRAVGDLTAFTPSIPAIDEIDATNRKGEYWVTLTAGENNYDVVSVGGILTAAVTDCEIIPTRWVNDQIDFTTTQKASINTEADASLSDIKLDHLIAVAESNEPADNSIIAKLVSKDATADWSDFDNTTDSLEANRDNIGSAGASLTSVGDTRLANLDATISSRTKPADTQAAVTTVGTVTNAVTITSNADVTAILADTNEIQGLISSSKLPAQVKGIDNDVITAASLNVDAVNEITAAIWAKVIDGTITFGDAITLLLAKLPANICDIVSPGVYAYKNQAGAVIFTMTITPTQQTGAI